MSKGVKVTLDKDRFLKYTLNSMRKLEKEHGLNIDSLAENFDLDKVQLLLHTGLLKDDPEVTFEEVGELVDMANIQYVIEKLTEALGGLQK